MNKRPIAVVVLLGWSLVTVTCSDPEPVLSNCDGADLAEALSGASSGDTVEVGSCRVTASLSVPAGVTLVGQGQDVSFIVAPAGQTAITLAPGTTATQLRQLSVESDTTGVVARGAGSVNVSNGA